MLTKPLKYVNNSTPVPQPRKKSKRRIGIAVTLAVIGLVAGIGGAFPKQFMYQVDISLIRQPTPYTQLFFNNPTVLPSQLHIDRPSKFTFTIVNDQGRSQRYRYTVLVSTVKSFIVTSKGSLTIRNGGTATRTVALVPKSRRSRYLITVALDPTGQSIHFYGDTS
jgi:hypothetical protein